MVAIKRVLLDFETRSKSNLKKEGAFKYSLDPSTQPTCLAFKIRKDPQVYFLPFEVVNRPWVRLPKSLQKLWSGFILGDFEFAAHNAFFERCIYTNILVKRLGWPRIPEHAWRCTAAKAASCALPRNLEGAGSALNLSVQKDKRGHAAMMKTCKPTAKWNKWKNARDKVAAGARVNEKTRALARESEPPMFLEYEDDPETWETLYTYCKFDVRTEDELDQALPDLIPDELDMWHLNQKLNWRGVRVDIPTIEKVVDIMAIESKIKLKELDALTMGLVTKPGARKSILEFLAIEGITLPDIRAKTVDDNLSGFALTEDARALLEIRKALSMTSTKKYQAFLDRAVRSDGRIRDILLYHGASTGRDSGTGVQPQNFPRGILKVDKTRPYAAVKNVMTCDADTLKLLYGDSLAVLFSAILRNMIIASEDHELFVADFSKIEVVVLWYLCGNKSGLEILRQGKDPYIYQAAQNLNKNYEDIDTEGDDRQLGKAQVLGCGFGMGPSKFQSTAWDMYRLKLTTEQAKIAVANYRKANAQVPEIWKAYERAAIAAVQNKGKVFKAGMCIFFVKGRFLWAELPSGRRLAYCDPQISWRVRTYDKVVVTTINGEEVETIQKVQTQPMETLEFWAVNSKTKKWSLERTWGGTLTENIVQATARDLMRDGFLRLEKAGYKALISVHDEVITEKKIGKGDLAEFTKILCEVPLWAKGMPIEAKGWIGPRYRK